MSEAIKICSFDECTACEACVQSCPNHCITMRENEDGFLYPHINTEKCLKCLKCVKVCHNNRTISKYNATFYMGWHKELEVLKKSSSGGAFTALADLVFRLGGVVFGASFDKKTRTVKHLCIENSNDLDRVRLSKYYQGSINDCYIKAKKILETKWVLFSGTACQIAGLYTFLGKNYDNLITVDVLCHGMASHKVVDAYIDGKEKKYRKKIVDFKFRLKPDDSDWLNGGGTRTKLFFNDGTFSVEDKGKDTYFVGFNSYLFLRKSCYSCKYIGIERIADFTLADYWGVPLNQITDRESKYGVSLILANTRKAKKLMDSLKKDMIIKEIDPQNAIEHNQALEKPSTFNPNREFFFQELDKKKFDYLVYKYNKQYYNKFFLKELLRKIMGDSLYHNTKRTIKRCLRHDE